MALPNNFTDISFKNLIARFLRLNIAMKMLVGYLPLAILLGIISVYSLSSLERLNHLSTSILKIDIPIAKSADGMIDDILAQELYARRHLILKSKNMKEIFAERGIDFQAKLDSIKLLPNAEKLPILTIETLHNEYETLFKKRFKYIKRPGSKTARNLDKQIEEKQLEITSLVKELNARSVEDQQRRTLLSAAVGDTAFKVAAVLCLLGFILGVGAAIIVSRSISSSVKKLKIATHMISEGNFSDLPEITNQDELGDLSQSFIEMGRRLSRLEEMYIDASPLTRLPGNIAIENVLKKRVESNSLTA
ncbi:MAG: HAMP domain-containing protein, partial [Deltaproteobacteria bacterium]|nr:HAMP domain-containing protein [Deltaproteobacteria bacterium]